MSRRPILQLLEDMLEVAGVDRQAFLEDDKTSDAVVRSLEVIGEACARLPDSLKDTHREIPWQRIVGLRNRVVHAYFDVDLELVWAIVHGEMPDLKSRLAVLRDSVSPSDDNGA